VITGDESSASNRAEYERNALALTKLVASAEVSSEVVLDLREHHNSSKRGKSPFEEFWLVVHDVSCHTLLAHDAGQMTRSCSE
jgi:hypothetical protein